MELIPILSTIILVATISTFILAVGAYILYKIREGKQAAYKENKPEQLKAEIVVPKEAPVKSFYVEDVLESEPKKSTTAERFKPVGFPKETIYEPAERFGRTAFRKTEDNEIEVEVPDIRFKRVPGNGHSLLSKEEIRDDIKWR